MCQLYPKSFGKEMKRMVVYKTNKNYQFMYNPHKYIYAYIKELNHKFKFLVKK